MFETSHQFQQINVIALSMLPTVCKFKANNREKTKAKNKGMKQEPRNI